MSEPEQTEAAWTEADGEYAHGSPLVSCRIDPTGTYLFTGGTDQRIVRWTLGSDDRADFVGHESWPWALACDAAGSTFISGGYDERLIWWDLKASEPVPLREVQAHAGWIRGVACDPQGQLVASAGNDHRVKLWSLADGALVRELQGHESHVYNVAFTPDGQTVVSGDLKGVVREWQVADGVCIAERDASVLYKYDGGFRADIGGTRGLAVSADGRYVAASGITNVSNAFAGVGNAAVVLFDRESGESRVLKLKEDLRAVCWAIDFHPLGLVVGAISGGGGSFLVVWDLQGETELWKLKLPQASRAMSLDNTARRVALAGYDGVARVYRLGEARP